VEAVVDDADGLRAVLDEDAHESVDSGADVT